tara:strand:+ start:702 stop:1133 length:432 start_codon:yes stop_codon:yes gene_type:complete
MLLATSAAAFSITAIASLTVLGLLPFLSGIVVADFVEDVEVEGTVEAAYAFSVTDGIFYLSILTPGSEDSDFAATWSADESLIDNLEAGDIALFYEYVADDDDDISEGIKQYFSVSDLTSEPTFTLLDSYTEDTAEGGGDPAL